MYRRMESGVPAITLNPAPRPSPPMPPGAARRRCSSSVRTCVDWNVLGASRSGIPAGRVNLLAPRNCVSPRRSASTRRGVIRFHTYFVPGWPGCHHSLLRSVSEHNVVDEADFGGHALQGQSPSALVPGPEVMVAFDIGLKAI